MDKYIPFANKQTELFSTLKPEEIFEALINFVEKQGAAYKLSDEKYKIKFELNIPDGSIVDITTNILETEDEKVCIEFVRNKGQ